jgi:hypothetical protein
LKHSTKEATNSVQSAVDNENVQVNQIFNCVNYIDRITLKPGEITNVIVAFLPELKDREKDNLDYVEVNGSLFFVCFKLTAPNEGEVNDIGPLGPVQHQSTTSVIHQTDDLTGKKSEIDFTTPDFQSSSKFRSRVCKSVFDTDVVLTGLNFGDCIIGEKYIKEFTILNKSEIDLFWSLIPDISNSKNWIKFLNIDDESFDCNSLPSYSTKRIKVVFLPTEIGEFTYDFEIENLNDSQNISLVWFSIDID